MTLAVYIQGVYTGTMTNKFPTIAEAVEARKSLRLISRTGTVHAMDFADIIIDSPDSKPRYWRGQELAAGETVRIETNRSNCGAMGQVRTAGARLVRHGATAGLTNDEVTCKRCAR